MSGRGTPRILVAGSVMGLAGVVAAYLFAGAERFWLNWITWFLFVLTTGLGAFFIVALEHVVGARWSIPLRRVPERVSSLVVLMAPAVLLALFSLPVIYSWTRPESMSNPLIAGKSAWLNVPFFSVRAFLCVGAWLLAYRILVTGSLRQDSNKDLSFSVRARRFGPLFMIVFAITITILAFDWVSSLEPEWYSDIFGVYLFAGTFLAGLSATTLAVSYLMSRGRLPGVGPDHVYNLGGFLFAFTVFWSYIGFAQYMLMWYANLPEEVFWYKARIEGGWGGVALGLAIFHFLIPFFVLIPREAKSDLRKLRIVAVLMLLSHWLDLYWMIFPALRGGGPLFGWPEISFGLLFVSSGLLWVHRAMRSGADMPIGDPFLREGLEFHL